MPSNTRFFIAIGFGCAGLVCALALAAFGETGDLRAVNARDIHMIAVSGPSAFLAGLICASLFGHPNGFGWFLAGCGALL